MSRADNREKKVICQIINATFFANPGSKVWDCALRASTPHAGSTFRVVKLQAAGIQGIMYSNEIPGLGRKNSLNILFVIANKNFIIHFRAHEDSFAIWLCSQ
jgi:hypothetical protein